MHRTAALFGALLLVGCQDNGLSQLEARNLGAEPLIEVRPAALDFGTVEDGGEEIRQFVISNIGDATLHVDSIDLAASAGFTILTEDTSFTLEPLADFPEEVRVIDVAFTPVSDRVATGQAIVNSNDESNPQVSVSLTGSSAAPWLSITPDLFDFGTEYIGEDCTDEQVLTLSNDGLEDLVITDIVHRDSAELLSLSQAPRLPITLAPGEQSQVSVAFDAWTSGSAEGTLEVTSNDPRGVISAIQYADTQHAMRTTDVFQQPTEVPVDIVFAIDQSCSMDARLTNLQNNFDTFINTIDSVTQAWRIGVVTLDSGCFNSGFIERSTPSYASVFNSAVVLGTDSQVSNDEKLFTMATDALGANCNAGFLRPGALLHIVFVSDEWEQGPMNASQMLSSAVAAKGGMSSLVKMSGIICPPSGCGIADGTAGEYADAVNVGGGVRLDITAPDWGAQVEDLASASLTGIGRYQLSQPADPNAIQVLVDGQTWTGWYYDEASQSVVFTDIPPAGSSITVHYGVSIDCN
jgi:hypothetical protein